jgi:hypothetical protein
MRVSSRVFSDWLPNDDDCSSTTRVLLQLLTAVTIGNEVYVAVRNMSGVNWFQFYTKTNHDLTL